MTCLNGKYTIFIYGKYKNGKKFGNKTVLIGIGLNDTLKIETMLGICGTRVQLMVNGIRCGQTMLVDTGGKTYVLT